MPQLTDACRDTWLTVMATASSLDSSLSTLDFRGATIHSDALEGNGAALMRLLAGAASPRLHTFPL